MSLQRGCATLRSLMRGAAAASQQQRGVSSGFFSGGAVLGASPLASSLAWRSPVPLVPLGARGVGSHGPGVRKTKSAIKKRFRVRGSGAIVRLQSGKRHLNLHKSSTRITSLGRKVTIASKGIRRKYVRALQLSPLRR